MRSVSFLVFAPFVVRHSKMLCRWLRRKAGLTDDEAGLRHELYVLTRIANFDLPAVVFDIACRTVQLSPHRRVVWSDTCFEFRPTGGRF